MILALIGFVIGAAIMSNNQVKPMPEIKKQNCVTIGTEYYCKGKK